MIVFPDRIDPSRMLTRWLLLRRKWSCLVLITSAGWTVSPWMRSVVTRFSGRSVVEGSFIRDADPFDELLDHGLCVGDAVVVVEGVEFDDSVDRDADGGEDVLFVDEEGFVEEGFVEGVVFASEVEEAGWCPELLPEFVGVFEEEFAEFGAAGFGVDLFGGDGGAGVVAVEGEVFLVADFCDGGGGYAGLFGDLVAGVAGGVEFDDLLAFLGWCWFGHNVVTSFRVR